MPLTVKDILEKTFKRSFKGYDEDEVDKFLDQIIDEFKAQQNEIESLKSELAAATERVKKVKHTEETIMNTLVSAQKSSERMINDAKRKAEIIISSAESTSKQKAEQTLRELAEAKSKIEELKSCAQGFATNFANMVNAQAAYFEKTYRSYFGQELVPLGGINTDALEKIDKDISRTLEDIGIAEEKAPEKKPDEADEAKEPISKEETDETGEKTGYMELFEINKMLSDIEDGITQETESEERHSLPKYNDYSWLYEGDGKQGETDVTFKDPKGKDELKSLIDEIIE